MDMIFDKCIFQNKAIPMCTFTTYVYSINKCFHHKPLFTNFSTIFICLSVMSM